MALKSCSGARLGLSSTSRESTRIRPQAHSWLSSTVGLRTFGRFDVLIEAKQVRRIVLVLQIDQSIVGWPERGPHRLVVVLEESGEIQVDRAIRELAHVFETVAHPFHIGFIIRESFPICLYAEKVGSVTTRKRTLLYTDIVDSATELPDVDCRQRGGCCIRPVRDAVNGDVRQSVEVQ